MRTTSREHRALKDFNLRLAYGGPGPAAARGLTPENPNPPALLVSVAYLSQFKLWRERMRFRDYSLDSGAFSLYHSGKPMSLDRFLGLCKELAGDPQLSEVFSLDDMSGNWRVTRKNTEALWRAGVEAIPTFHMGEPWDVLKGLAADYPKVALGGMANRGQRISQKEKLRWCGQCFSRVWPKRIHGFGCAGRELLLALPFHSVDATNWEIGATRYGQWRSFGPLAGLRGGKQNLRAEVEHYLKMEREVRARWKKEMALLGRQHA